MEIDLLRVNFRYPSNEPQTLPAFGRLLIQLRLLYYLAAIACVRIYIYARVPIYIYILNCFVICLAHGERPLQHVESRLTVGKTLHREDNRDSKGCVSPKQAVFMHLYFTTYVYFIHISLIHIYI